MSRAKQAGRFARPGAEGGDGGVVAGLACDALSVDT